MTNIIGDGCIAKCDMFTIDSNGRRFMSYMVWKSMLTRCYNPAYVKRFPAYNGCSVDNKWLLYSSFKEWYDKTYPNNGKKYQLDKDILVPGNKIYSDITCCWVPPNINKLLTYKKNGNLYSGITFYKNTYCIRINDPILNTRLRFTETNLQKAIDTYRTEKIKIIKKVALDSYTQNEITIDVFNSLNMWNV